jgi:hypothetical protein
MQIDPWRMEAEELMQVVEEVPDLVDAMDGEGANSKK